MPKAENSRKSPPASSSSAAPLSPRRAPLPVTPAANSKLNPLEVANSSPKAGKSAGDSPITKPRATSEVPPSRPPATLVRSSSSEAVASAGRLSPPSEVAETRVAAVEVKSSDEKPSPINMETFSQILELDEDDDTHSFSKSIVSNYFEQFGTTYKDIGHALDDADLPKLSSLGHFLKGSSAALGVSKVQATCEKIQNIGQMKEDGRVVDLTKDQALSKLRVLYGRVDGEFEEAKQWFEAYFPDGITDDA